MGLAPTVDSASLTSNGPVRSARWTPGVAMLHGLAAAAGSWAGHGAARGKECGEGISAMLVLVLTPR